MKFYIAGYSGIDSDEMDYKKLGGSSDLYRLFPELKEVIKSYPIKNIDVRFSNGDRLRIYDIFKEKGGFSSDKSANLHSPYSNAVLC